jgi:hypothetical protein
VQRAGRGWIVMFRFRLNGPATATPCELRAGRCLRSFPSAFLTGGPTRLGVFVPSSSGRGFHVYAIVFRNGRETLRLAWPAVLLR